MTLWFRCRLRTRHDGSMSAAARTPGRKICLLTSVHPAFDVRIFQKEAKSLASAGYDVTVIVPHEKDETVDGVHIKALSRPANRVQRALLATWTLGRTALAARAAVYHLQDPELLLLGVLLKLCGKTVVYDVHEDLKEDILTKEYIPRAARTAIAWLANACEKSFSRIFDAVVTATDHIASNFAGYPAVLSLKNYPRLTDFTRGDGSEEENGRPPGFRCVYVGGLTEVRGISQTVEAMERLEDLEDVTLVLYGIFDAPAYQQELSKHKGFRKTDYRGWANYRRIPSVLSTMDAGVVCVLPYPHFVVGLPIKMFEYMLAGIPVVASNFPQWREIIEDARCGICVDPRDPGQIADAIRYLYEHPEERKEMGRRGQQAVQEKYNWEKESQKLVALYRVLLGDSGPSETSDFAGRGARQ
jgi:glycosyltransferase involved in cell wall biosynthesis